MRYNEKFTITIYLLIYLTLKNFITIKLRVKIKKVV
jgi:hypothetical protein